MQISILTATLNNARIIRPLVDSLLAQTDKEFEWIVCDGLSLDGTVEEIITATQGLINCRVIRESDFGLYDAINRGIKVAQGQYYLVIGADDVLEYSAVSNYKRAIINTSADLILSCVKINDAIVRPVRSPKWFLHQKPFVAGHSVGTLIRKKLHDDVGYYSKRYPIAADHLFLEMLLLESVQISFQNFTAGRFGTDGISSKDKVGALTESYRIQLQLGRSKFVETVIFILRLIWNYKTL
jgi:glycosyltransferase involved in cell wall biosynthesis